MHCKDWQDCSVSYDTFHDSSQLEWLIRNPDDIHVTGLMIKISTVDPHKAILDRFEENFKIKNERSILTFGEKSDGFWMWNSDSNHTLTVTNNDVFRYYTPDQNSKIEKAYKDGQTHIWLDLINTGKDQTPYFIDFGNMEQINCKYNTRRRRIKRTTKRIY